MYLICYLVCYSLPLPPSTAPTPVRNATITRVLQDGVELNWLPPTEPNGEVHYVIEYKREDSGNWTSINTTSDSTHYNLTGLHSGTNYTIRVVAVSLMRRASFIFSSTAKPTLHSTATPTTSSTATPTSHRTVISTSPRIVTPTTASTATPTTSSMKMTGECLKHREDTIRTCEIMKAQRGDLLKAYNLVFRSLYGLSMYILLYSAKL